MTSQRTAHGRFQRAIERGQFFHAKLSQVRDSYW
jgi:hypothetical protein